MIVYAKLIYWNDYDVVLDANINLCRIHKDYRYVLTHLKSLP